MTSTANPTRRAWLGRVAAPGLLAAVLLGIPAWSLAGTLKAADAKAVRAVIQAQLDAFAAGNAARAFAFATPGIRQQFGDATRFMSMVITAYPMVVRPNSVAFFQAQQEDGLVSQTLRLRDHEGQYWLATYAMQRQASGKWLINGCVVHEDDERSSV
jgi:Domain of unknown function (DUF4864)